MNGRLFLRNVFFFLPSTSVLRQSRHCAMGETDEQENAPLALGFGPRPIDHQPGENRVRRRTQNIMAATARALGSQNSDTKTKPMGRTLTMQYLRKQVRNLVLERKENENNRKEGPTDRPKSRRREKRGCRR